MTVEGKAAPILTLKEYLAYSQPDPLSIAPSTIPRVLIVPPWQREYVWQASETGEVGVLLDDLYNFVTSPDEDYLMGTVLLSRGAENPTDRLLIDGQQRTITYSILLMAILRYVQNNFKKVAHLGNHDQNAIEQKTLVDLRECLSTSDSVFGARISMPHSNADKMLQMIWHWSKMAEGDEANEFISEKENWTQTQRNLLDVATWLYDKKLTGENWVRNDDLLKHVRKILDKVKFLQITLSSQQEAIAIFDRINSRGALLDSGDLIKNRIFQAVENEEDFGIISQRWISMTDSLAKCSMKRMREPKFLLRALALAEQDAIKKDYTEVDTSEPSTKMSAPKITYEKLTNYWGDRLDPEGTDGDKRKIMPLDFASRLQDASIWLEQLSNDKTNDGKLLPELYFAKYLNCVQHFPMLMAARNIEKVETLRHLTRQVHVRTAYYLLSEERTQDYESMVPTWTALIAKAGPKATKSDLDSIFKEYICIPEEKIDALVLQMHGWSYASSDRKKIRALLSQLTRLTEIAGGEADQKEIPIEYFSTKKDLDTKESWDIDHIQPKLNSPKDSPLHKVGNLVLLKAKHNTLKNKSKPIDKEDTYKGSHLLLTQTLTGITLDDARAKVNKFFESAGVESTDWNLDGWDQADMEIRADLYGKLLKHHLMTYV